MPDEGTQTAVEKKPKLELSKKDAQKLAEMTASLLAPVEAEKPEEKADASQRPEFDAELNTIATGLPEHQKGLLPGGYRVHLPDYAKGVAGKQDGASLSDSFVKTFSINKFPKDMDAKDFSVARVALAQKMSGATTPRAIESGVFKSVAPLEKAYYDALDSYGHESKAIGEMVSGQDGGFLAPEIWTNTFFDMLYPAQVLSRLPITRLQMAGRVQHIPKLTSQMAIAYAAESGALSATQPQFSQLSFTARKQYGFAQIPNELIRDSAPAADQIIFQHAQTRMAVDRDTQILLGNGQSGAPVGLLNSTNVGTYTIAADAGNGGSPTYTDLVTLVNLVRQLNNSTNVPVGQTDCTGVVGAVRVEQTVAALKDSNQRPLWAYGLNQIGRVPAPGFLGVPNWVLTNIDPTNVTKGAGTTCSYLFAGDWQYLVYMMRQDVEFLATNVGGTAFANDQTWIRLISRFDVGVIHPEAFTYANGVLA